MDTYLGGSMYLSGFSCTLYVENFGTGLARMGNISISIRISIALALCTILAWPSFFLFSVNSFCCTPGVFFVFFPFPRLYPV